MGNNNYRKKFRLLTSLFFMWGFITVSNDILIARFKNIFDLSAIQGSLVQVAFFVAFFVISLLYLITSYSLKKSPINIIGYKNGMSVSLLICGLACLSFYPSAINESYFGFLSSLFILASGVTLLQICANPYATILGDAKSSSSRLNLAQGLNSLGTTLGPIVGGILIYQLFTSETDLLSIAKTYLVYGSAFIILSLITWRSNLPDFQSNEELSSPWELLKNKSLLFGVIAIFCYVGAEVSIGSWLINFISLPDIGGVTEVEATFYLSYFWGGLMIGRLMGATALNHELSLLQKRLRMLLTSLFVFVLIFIVTGIKYKNGILSFESLALNRILFYWTFIILAFVLFNFCFNKPGKNLVLFSICNIALVLTTIFTNGDIAFWSILGTGLFLSVGWSNIFSLAIKDLGKDTSTGSSLLVMAIVGGAVLPFIQGIIIDKYSIQTSFLIPLVAFIYIAFYGFFSSKNQNT